MGFVIVMILSYVFVEIIVQFADLLPALFGINAHPDTMSTLFENVLLFVSTVFVGVFFTLPALLAMFGHGGAWVKHVVSRSVKKLSIALGLAFAFYFASSVASENPPNFSAVPDLDLAVVLVPIVLFVLLLFSRGALVSVVSKAMGALQGALPPLDLELFGRTNLASAEFRQVPTRQIREKSTPERIREETIRFQRLVQTLANLGGKCELRLAFIEGRGRVLLSARSRQSKSALQQWLLAIAKTHLPDFAASVFDSPAESSNAHAHSILVEGVPEMVENPLEPLARYFLQNKYEGEYLIIIRRSLVNPLSRFMASRKQRRLARQSGEQVTEHSALSPTEKLTSARDYLAEMELEDSIKWLQRYSSSRALKAWVYITARAGTVEEARRIAEGASHVLQGALSSQMAKSALKVHGIRRPIGGLRPSGRPTLLLPVEAVPYFWVPQIAMGAEIVPSTEFEMPPELKGEVELGKIVTQSGETDHLASIPLDLLARHTFVTGLTGTGKTTTCFNLLMQVYQLGIPFLVLEPVKSEYRTLLAAIPGLQVFTVGDEETAPFRLNIFEPPSGVKVQTHLENLEAAWNASFVMYAPLPLVVKQVLAETYRACGWDVANNRRGRSISLDDFRFHSEKVSRALGYEQNVLMNIEAALRARINSLTLGGKGAIFNTIASTPVEDVLRRPTVIELKNIPNTEEKAFIAALILMNIVEHIETKGQSKQLRHLTLIEEAHRLLPNISTEKGDPEAADPRRRMVEQFANMLAEIRAYGEGLAIVEQIPTKIIPDAVKNTATKIAHRVPAADDRKVLAGAMNLTKEQESVFTALQPGEAIVSLERHPLPIKVKVANAMERFGLPDEIGNDDVKRHMTEFYLRNPLPRASQSKLNADLLRMVESRWFEARFAEAYDDWRETGKKESLATLLVESAKKFSKSEEEILGCASRILDLAAERYLRFDEEKAEFPRSFMRSVERWMRDARRI